MAIVNTGYKGYSTLLKVTNDGNNSPLDINNNLCSESGLPQATKSNTIGDPDYIAPVYDIVTCPLPSGATITITGKNSNVVQCGAGDDTKIIVSSVILSSPVTVDTIFTVGIVYSINGSCTTSLGTATTDVTILAGETSGDSPECSGGAPGFPSEITAVICSSTVTGHNNVVDTIIL